MNYLAHFHLARADDDALVGALLGDHVKGPLRGDWPAGWERGIALHRRIDALSDRHPLRAELAAALPPLWRRYAGIVLDVCCDHWLSMEWSRWHGEPLPAFAARVYAVLAQHEAALPAPAQRFARRLREYDMLNAYGEWGAVPATLQRIGARLSHANPLGEGDTAYRATTVRLRGGFAGFYTDLQRDLAAAGFIPEMPLSAAR